MSAIAKDDLITLTAEDLAGCIGGMLCQTIVGDAVFHGVTTDGLSVWLIKQGRQYTSLKSLKAHPHDYIRAWLENVGRLFSWADMATYSSRLNAITLWRANKQQVVRLDCPPALAKAMGDDWKRTENGWEVAK